MKGNSHFTYQESKQTFGVPESSDTTPQRNGYTTSNRFDLLINWVNSIEYPNCLLASDISDFKYGIIFCEIVNEYILHNQKPDFLVQVKGGDVVKYQDTLHNMNMALNEIKALGPNKVPSEILNLKPHEIVSNEDKIIELLDFLYNHVKGGSTNKRSENNVSDFAAENNIRVDDYQLPVSKNITPNKPNVSLTPSTQTSTNQSIPNKLTQKPPRSSTVSARVKSPAQSQPSNRNEYIVPPSTENYMQETPPPVRRADLYDPSQVHSSNFQQSGSLNNDYYEYPESSQHLKLNTNPFGSINSNSKNSERVESINPYDSQGLDYSDLLTKSVPPISTKDDYKINQNIHTKTGVHSHRGFHSSQKVNENSHSTRQEIELNNYLQSRASEPIFIERTSNNFRELEASPIPIQKGAISEDPKLRTSIIQQRIGQLQEKKENLDINLNQKRVAQENFSPMRRSEMMTSVRSGLENEKKQDTEVVKKPEKIVVAPVNEDTKARLIEWLVSITLIKENVKDIDRKLPNICRNGVIFIDLINRLEGKHETIKGANRKPEIKSQIYANYQKLFNYLGKFEKMNPRFLYAHDILIEGNEDAFWGLLDDIWHLFNKKLSPFDTRFAKEERKSNHMMQSSMRDNYSIRDPDKSRRSHLEVSYNDICYFDKSKMNTSQVNISSPSKIRNRSPSENDAYDSKGQRSANQSVRSRKQANEKHSHLDNSGEAHDAKRLSLQKYDVEEKTQQGNTGYLNLYSKKNYMTQSSGSAPNKSIMKKGDDSKFFSKSFMDEHQNDYTSSVSLANGISVDGEVQVKEWLKSLGFKALLMRESTSLFEDPFRNGTLLNYVVGKIENERMHGTFKEPKTIEQCRHNVLQVFQTLARKHTPIPSFLKRKEEAVLRGDRNVILSLLHALMKINETKTEVNTSMISIGDRREKQEASMYIPPYNDEEREALEKSLIGWINSLGVFNDSSIKPQDFRELIILLKNGLLLCDLTTVVSNTKLTTIHRKPINELQCVTNIRRGLEALREKKNMAQRYLWKERDIYSGNRYIILGLLEDMHRFFDGMPPRSNPNYFMEGPYIPRAEEQIQGQSEKSHNVSTHDISKSQGRIGAKLDPSVSFSGRGFSSGLFGKTGVSDIRTQESNRSRLLEQAKLNLSSDEPISIMDYERRNHNGAVTSPSRNRNTGTNLNSSASRWENLNDIDSYRSPKSAAGRNVGDLNQSARRKEFSLLKAPSQISQSRTLTTVEDDNSKQTRQTTNYFEGDDLAEWIVSLGLGSYIKDTNFSNETIDDFKDGVLLCKILEALELKQIPGIILKPRTNASRHVNIRKCLNVLSKKPSTNPHYMHIEDKLLAGDGETIRKLLYNIREAYRFMNKCIQKTQSRSPTRSIDDYRQTERRTDKSIDDKSRLYRPQENYILSPAERKKAIIPAKYARD